MNTNTMLLPNTTLLTVAGNWRCYLELVGREDDGAAGFGDYLVEYLARGEWERYDPRIHGHREILIPTISALRAVACIVNAYSPLPVAVSDFEEALRVGGGKASFGTRDAVPAVVPPSASTPDRQSRHLALMVLIDSFAAAGERLPRMVQQILAFALGASKPVANDEPGRKGRNPGSLKERRDRLSRAAEIEGRALAGGAKTGEAVNMVLSEMGVRLSTIKPLRSKPLYKRRCEEAQRFYSANPRPFLSFTKHHDFDALLCWIDCRRADRPS